jgi:hypothetical protein
MLQQMCCLGPTLAAPPTTHWLVMVAAAAAMGMAAAVRMVVVKTVMVMVAMDSQAVARLGETPRVGLLVEGQARAQVGVLQQPDRAGGGSQCESGALGL